MDATDISVGTNLILKIVVTERILRQNKKYDETDCEMLTHGPSDIVVC